MYDAHNGTHFNSPNVQGAHMNPAALVLWAILGLIGWLIASTSGAVVGVLVGMILSVIATVIH